MLKSLVHYQPHLSVLLAVVLACSPAVSQDLAVKPASDDDLKIEVIEGNDFVNNIRQRTARDPVVEVRDRNNKPLAGVAVTFKLPTSGPSGSFSNGLQTFTTTTDANGRAVGQGLKPNSNAGQVRIEVEAQQGGRVARAVINGKNVRGFKFPLKASVTTGVVAAAAAAAIAVAVTRSGSTGSSGTGVSVGAPTIGSK